MNQHLPSQKYMFWVHVKLQVKSQNIGSNKAPLNQVKKIKVTKAKGDNE